MAAMETTTATLRWAILFLTVNGHVQNKMREEIFRVLGRDGQARMADKNEMPYCSAALLEIQRRANIMTVNLPHKTLANTTVGGNFVPKGTLVIPQLSSVMADPERYRNPNQLIPERFLEEDGTSFRKDAIEGLIPFSIGKRQCIGESLARMELFLVLITLLQNFELQTPDGRPELDLEPLPGPLRRPKHYLVKLVRL